MDLGGAKRRFLSPHEGCVRSDGSSLRFKDLFAATVPLPVLKMCAKRRFLIPRNRRSSCRLRVSHS